MIIRRWHHLVALAALLLALSVTAVRAQAATECEPGFHLFDHEYLDTDPVCIPDDPQRIIALDLAALEFLFYTDKQIVGSTQWVIDELAASLPVLRDQLLAIPDMGYPANSEAILQADPDLILAYNGGDGLIDYAQVAAIAPTVVTSLAVQDWERTTAFWSAVLGEQDTFEAMKANYDARIAELGEALPYDPATVEVSLTTAMSYGLDIWMSDSPQGKILADVGFARPASQIKSPNEGEYWLIISEEQLEMADGDEIFLFAYATTDEEVAAQERQVIAEFQQNPLWLTLEGVRAGRVHVVPGYWYRAATYLMAHRIIDDLFAALTDTAAGIQPLLPPRIEAATPEPGN